MSTTIDLSRISGLIDLGTHTFQVTDRSREDMGPSGNACWYLICEVISAGENQGRELLHTISLGQKSRFIMDEFLDGIGAPKKGNWTLEKCIGKKFRASVTHEPYEGKMRTKIASTIAASDLEQSFDTLKSELEQPDEALPDDVVVGDSEVVEEDSSAPKRFG